MTSDGTPLDEAGLLLVPMSEKENFGPNVIGDDGSLEFLSRNWALQEGVFCNHNTCTRRLKV